jgi:glycosyltransferase, family 2
MKCLNIIIYYDNKEEVEAYITNVVAISDEMLDIVVVVNKDTKNLAIELEDKLKSMGISICKFINYGENVGYLNAMLFTIRKIDIKKYDYVILSNTDIEYSMNRFFYELSCKTYSANIGAIAPSIYSPNTQRYQNPHYLKRIKKSHFKRLYFLFKFPTLGKLYLQLSSFKRKKKPVLKEKSCMVYSPHGAYMIFTNKFISLISDYTYGALLYSEESCIGELLIKNGMKCYYDSTLEVIHYESTVTGSIDYKKRFDLWRKSIKVILDEFY